ncbi:MAG: hypothetical protein MZV65_42220 [Chromatiales bacterium]|nr:hypothetical protein [Chromatiales bacterium]
MSIWFRPLHPRGTRPAVPRLHGRARSTSASPRSGPDYLRGHDAGGRTAPGSRSGCCTAARSVALAETLGSVAANRCVDPGRFLLRGPGDQCQPPARRAQRPASPARPGRSTSAAARRSGRSASRTSGSG